ncbi:MAG: methyltransferase [Bacteroidetes bacterium]|nr:MAG: methyltransferase [Bacteroidota bacterium]
MTRDQAKATIEKLVERFREHRNDYHLPDYNEAKTRQDFINPFFKALGWDIDNEKGDSEAYREVIYEDKVVVKGKAKAPDYGFRLSGSAKKRLFYVEAKKPSVSLKANKESAYQLRRYGSSALAYVSILTNFEDFIVYDCSRVPNLHDSASVARLKHIPFEKYLEEFDFIYDTFSHEAVTHGKFDKFVQSTASKRGTDALDKRFVKSLDTWRRYLAVSIALNNRKLNDEEINYSVQQTIDRLIFLRFSEDRAVEPYGTLQKEISKGNAYQNLFHLFKLADDKYNSGLFDFKKDVITPHLKVDNKVIKKIIEELYYDKCNFEFSVMPVEILGNAYEQFLGKVIHRTPSGVSIKEKPEVRKAGGVFYTPQYIVEYIVKNTVGKLVDGKSPKEIEKIKIVDPACGSGSFLLGAYEYLLNYHINWYHNKGYATKKGKDNPFTPQGTLTTHEKKSILLSNIFGVDIDANAVEVTKLGLLLKCMEGETEASIKQQMSMFHERVLPDLDNNIKAGNSLIDTDIYNSEMDLGFEKKIKPFNWKQAFPEVFRKRLSLDDTTKRELKEHYAKVKQQDIASNELLDKLSGTVQEPIVEYGHSGGFDVIIGNPPYVRIHELDDYSKKYFIKKYYSAQGQFDLYQLFYEKSIGLLNLNGVLGFITSNKFCVTNYGKNLRDIIFNKTIIEKIVDCSATKVFGDASTYPFIFVLNKGYQSKNKTQLYEDVNRMILFSKEVDQNQLLKGNEQTFSFTHSQDTYYIIEKIEKNSSMNALSVYRGRGTSKDITEKATGIKSLTNREIERYRISNKTFYRKENAYENDFSSKILMKKICYNLECALDSRGEINPINTVYVIKPILADIEFQYLLGILNSSLMSFYARTKYSATGMRGGYIELRVFEVEKLPIIVPQERHFKAKEFIINNVKLLMKLNEELKVTKLQSDTEQLKQKIAHSEEKINELVYELYNLTKEEIKIIEGKKQ